MDRAETIAVYWANVQGSKSVNGLLMVAFLSTSHVYSGTTLTFDFQGQLKIQIKALTRCLKLVHFVDIFNVRNRHENTENDPYHRDSRNNLRSNYTEKIQFLYCCKWVFIL